jgi:hypothetical protein
MIVLRRLNIGIFIIVLPTITLIPKFIFSYSSITAATNSTSKCSDNSNGYSDTLNMISYQPRSHGDGDGKHGKITTYPDQEAAYRNP